MWALEEAGRRIPDDVAVIGFDDIEEGRFARPPLTTIAIDRERMGHLALSLLLERIEGVHAGPPRRIETSFRLVTRASTMSHARLSGAHIHA